MFRLWIKKLQYLGLKVSDAVSWFVGTWTFVFLYTLSMFVWIILHQMGILHIDSQDFMKWNLWLSYFAGTQASLVLMSSTRQANVDRKKQKEALEFDIRTLEVSESTQKKVLHLTDKISMLESLIDQFIDEEDDKHQ